MTGLRRPQRVEILSESIPERTGRIIPVIPVVESRMPVTVLEPAKPRRNSGSVAQVKPQKVCTAKRPVAKPAMRRSDE